MGKEPDPHACRPNSMDLNDAADMRDEAEQAFNDARKTRGKRDLLYVAVMACVIVMLTGAVCGRKDIIIASTVIAVAFSCAGSLACYRMKKSLHTYHENNVSMAWRKERNDMRKTTMAQVVEFAGQLNVTLQNISEDENTHGLAEAYNRLAQVMDELCIPMREEEVLEPISHEEACETAERLYRQLIEQAKDHTTIRLAQAMNRAWAELTVVEGLDRLARPQSKDE